MKIDPVNSSKSSKKTFNLSLYLGSFFALNIAFGCFSLGWVRGLQTSAFLLPIPFILSSAVPKTFKKWTLALGLLLEFIIASYYGIQGYLMENYQADLLSTVIIESLSNTTVTEATDYLSTSLLSISFWFLAFAIVFSLSTILLIRLYARANERSTFFYGLTFVFTAIFCFAFYQNAWRNKFPVFIYEKLIVAVDAQQDYWKEIEVENKKFLRTAENYLRPRDEKSAPFWEKPQTIVLVIGESTSREAMSLYGYSRDTTPNLKQVQSEDNRFMKAKEAFSTKFSTVSAFNSMLEFEPTPFTERGHLLAFFQKAGFHITWISNQDDIGIKSEFQSFAHSSINLNNRTGRSSSSMDEKVLPELERALEEKYPRHLIIVHLIGIHPHFSLRYPKELKANWSEDEEKSESRKFSRRSVRSLVLKNQYDMGMLYQDKIIAQTLNLVKKDAEDETVSWIFLSDHGAETGERGDLLGHSSKTLGGYTIPFLFWSNKPELAVQAEEALYRPFRGDWLSYLLLDIADIPCRFPIKEKSWISAHYQWKEPEIISKLKKEEAAPRNSTPSQP